MAISASQNRWPSLTANRPYSLLPAASPGVASAASCAAENFSIELGRSGQSSAQGWGWGMGLGFGSGLGLELGFGVELGRSA